VPTHKELNYDSNIENEQPTEEIPRPVNGFFISYGEVRALQVGALSFAGWLLVLGGVLSIVRGDTWWAIACLVLAFCLFFKSGYDLDH